MKHFWLIVFMPFCFVGCTTDFWADAMSQNHKNVYDSMFADSIKDDIQAEVKSEKPWHASSWQDFWIGRCQQVYDSPEMGAADVKYIIDQRRAAGLPDIPEIEKMLTNGQK